MNNTINKEKERYYINLSTENNAQPEQESSNLMTSSSSLPVEVVGSCYKPLFDIFQTLLLKKNWRQQDLADFVGIDKANISRIVHGLYIPCIEMRLKIAKALEVDSSVIWRYQDLQYIKDLIKTQTKQCLGGV